MNRKDRRRATALNKKVSSPVPVGYDICENCGQVCTQQFSGFNDVDLEQLAGCEKCQPEIAKMWTEFFRMNGLYD